MIRIAVIHDRIDVGVVVSIAMTQNYVNVSRRRPHDRVYFGLCISLRYVVIGVSGPRQ